MKPPQECSQLSFLALICRGMFVLVSEGPNIDVFEIFNIFFLGLRRKIMMLFNQDPTLDKLL